MQIFIFDIAKNETTNKIVYCQCPYNLQIVLEYG